MDIFDDFDLLNDPDGYLIDLIEDIYPEQEYNLRPRIDHFNYWNDAEFFNRFRFSKATVMFILQLVDEALRNRTERNLARAVSTLDKVLLTLRFLASGDFYVTMGDFTGIHKTTAGRIIKHVINALCNLFPQNVHLPQTEEEQQQAKIDFYNLSHFPMVIGAVDCTHVKIISTGGDNAEIFRNRKGYFSPNCQVVGSAKLKIIDLVSRWPGSANDSHIFENSSIKMRLQNREMGNGVLLADRGYALQPYLLIPLDRPHSEAEHLYNEAPIRTRNSIERLFGIWKRRFPVLSIGIRCKIELAQMIIVACAVLHNIAVDQKEEDFDDGNNFMDDNNIVELEPNGVPGEEDEDIGVRAPFIDYFRDLLAQRHH